MRNFIRKLVEFLEDKAEMEKAQNEEEEEDVFVAWPLGVKGELTRREIYDYP